MAAPPPSIQLRQEDFPKGVPDDSAMGQLLLPLVGFSKAVTSAMTGGLSVSQNLKTQVVPISFQTPATDWIQVPTTAYAGTWTGSIRYRVDAQGLVHLGGLASNPAATTAPSTILSAGALPVSDIAANFPTIQSGTVAATLQVSTTGQLILQTSAGVAVAVTSLALEGVRYTPLNYAGAVLSCFPFNAYTSIVNPSLVVLTTLSGPQVNLPNPNSATAPQQNGHGAVKYHTKNRDGVGSGSVLVIDNIPGCALNTRYTGNLLVFQ